MPDPKPAPKRTYESETIAPSGLRLVKDTPQQPREEESLPASACITHKDVVERLLDRIKRI